ncbi:hypothetical protein DYB31_014710 [Aphanomyces astaci]|uniref:Uncharacterized protein n=1 Tax=Aphanomyces astaci TaxID=112090 RepID=A0A397ED48_APHAT|nr:hypothetical protein DYB31_014710 [Aphanomyces astaci]
MTPDNQTRLVEGIGSTIDLSVAEVTAAQKALEKQVAQMSSHGRNLEDSLRIAREKIATLEDQASTMSSHGCTLQDSLRIAHDEIARLTRALTSHLNVSRPTLARFLPYRARYSLTSPSERST